MECIDSPDITIRIQALNLVRGMVSSDNLMSIVSRLMRQLKSSSASGRQSHSPQEAGSDDEADAEVAIDPRQREAEQAPPLPDDYKIEVIERVLIMCSQDNYSNVVDFEWYIDILTQLVRMAPVPRQLDDDLDANATSTKPSAGGISEKIGNELRNVAVKVNAIRPAAVNAAELILKQVAAETTAAQPVTSGALGPLAWTAGEYCDTITSPEDTLGHLLQIIPRAQYPDVLASCLQAIIKIMSNVTGSHDDWTSERKAKTALLLARIIHVLEPLVLHPNLEVQERAVEFTELLKLTSEAVSGQPASNDEFQQDPPLLLTQAIPSLFTGWELNSVAITAQKNVPLPDGLDLDEPIHPDLAALLAAGDTIDLGAEEEDEFEVYYHQKPPPTKISSSEPAINKLADAPEEIATSYQASEDSYLDTDILERRKAERAERNKDDPFYIGAPASRTGTSTPIHHILHNANGPDLDIDAIPIMQLDLGKLGEGAGLASSARPIPRPKPRQRIIVAQDENLAGSGGSTPRNYDSENNSDALTKARAKKLKQSLLQVDSSNIGSLSLEGGDGGSLAHVSGYDYERQKQEETEMAQAMKEVERLRLEMQRANERIHVAQGVDVEGVVVKKKKKKTIKPNAEGAQGGEGGESVAVKPKRKKKANAAAPDVVGAGNGEIEAQDVVKPRKRKKPKPPAETQEAA